MVKHYQLPDEPKPLSGEGHLFEYYHFLIDFAAEVLYLLGHAEKMSCSCRIPTQDKWQGVPTASQPGNRSFAPAVELARRTSAERSA